MSLAHLDCARCCDGTPAAVRDAFGEAICEVCEARDQDRHDRALLAEFYGGDGPVTIHDWTAAAYKERQR